MSKTVIEFAKGVIVSLQNGIVEAETIAATRGWNGWVVALADDLTPVQRNLKAGNLRLFGDEVAIFSAPQARNVAFDFAVNLETHVLKLRPIEWAARRIKALEKTIGVVEKEIDRMSQSA